MTELTQYQLDLLDRIDKLDLSVLDELADISHTNSREHGFWADDPSEENPRLHYDGNRIMLMVSELVEAHDELRTGHAPDEIYQVNGKWEGVPVELADTFIRGFDYSGGRKIPLSEAIKLKLIYNVTRPHMHGKLF